ncbi:MULTISPECIES: 2OG-Fe(II) oxygenase [Bacillaceae]|uniref:2OG-Fe(II) oxygenase n=1 Tax=Bacillaceae TaxID=186817 RepID=UPI000BFC2886|nr:MULTISPECIES: 2OG-Fe(II) oxygenase [Bacillaceae]PGT83467.1 hypothetical protein COD11_12715 [Bacillus sp. AFS040349]UGB31353.1 2OG-Fe(II) oxygenase [Metabacillus sp. B2-18]UGB33634.1 2OG-Fe(II) oxygenase [Metabacillus sp. B2-18]
MSLDTLQKSKNELLSDINELITGMDMAEKINMQLLLSLAVGGLAPNNNKGSDEISENAFNIAVELMTQFRDAGLVKYERPSFMTNELLNALIKESKEVRKIAVRPGKHYLSPAGKVAEELALSNELVQYVNDALGYKVIPNEISSYLYYEEPGDGIPAHVDSDVFSINCIIGLSHEMGDHVENPSSLVVYSNDGKPKRILLKPGELVLLLAGGSVHEREPVVEGEKVSILTVGLRRG